MEKNRIYVVTHKNYSIVKNELYKTIKVGPNPNVKVENMVGDNTGENISDKNSNYCELTALYWIWKNDIESLNVGLCHYRRYFTTRRFSKNSKYFLSDTDINKSLSKYDIILPSKHYMFKSVKEQYYLPKEELCFKKDYETLECIVKKLYPDYSLFFDKVSSSSSVYFYNMFVMKKELLNYYCEWLFNILDVVEKNIDISEYSSQQKRIFGYMSERLLNVWVLKNNLKIKEYPICKTENKVRKDFSTYLKNRICFFINKCINKEI